MVIFIWYVEMFFYLAINVLNLLLLLFDLKHGECFLCGCFKMFQFYYMPSNIKPHTKAELACNFIIIIFIH